ncbi:ATP-binding protein [Uliginosibacterium sp. H1]|uniref:ATP-binding protein n=1 Tax=Uliginosibacterium sp. H1 TaxID=3114757 RepID=UPI002E19C245|nr:ATP-binding protein [Uliginosibacterium sp. H1]
MNDHTNDRPNDLPTTAEGPVLPASATTGQALPAYSLRRRLLWLLFAAIAAATLVQAAVVYRMALTEVDRISDYHMQQIALSIRSGQPLPPAPQDLSPRSNGAGFDLFIQAWSDDGVRIFGSAASGILPQQAVLGFSTVQANGRSFRVLSLQGDGHVIQVAHDMAARDGQARQLALRTVTPLLIVVPLLLLGVWWLISHATTPIAQAREQVARRSASDLRPLPTTGLPEELLPFVDEINTLFGRVRASLDAQQAFVADAAHELRSPLAALRLQAQGLQRAPDDEARRVAGERLLAGIDRSTRLVEQMLALARAEAADGEVTQVDLRQVLQLALGDVLPQAQARGIDLGVSENTPLATTGNAEALRILLRNLMENAVKYTPEGGVVDVSLRPAPTGGDLPQGGRQDAALLQVEDSGPGIPEDQRGRVFSRFHRGDNPGIAGSGLGLSIVQAIAERHGSRVVLDRSPRLGGLRASLRLEAVPAGQQ